MYVFLISDILLVKMVHLDLLLTMRCAQQEQEISLELIAIVVDVFFGIFANKKHLSNMALALDMHLEAIFISHLSFAYLMSMSVSALRGLFGDRTYLAVPS